MFSDGVQFSYLGYVGGQKPNFFEEQKRFFKLIVNLYRVNVRTGHKKRSSMLLYIILVRMGRNYHSTIIFVNPVNSLPVGFKSGLEVSEWLSLFSKLPMWIT